MDEKRFTLRMDGELFDEISNIAKEHRRSTAKEIEVAVALYLRSLNDQKYMSMFYEGIPRDDLYNQEKQRMETNKRYEKHLKE